MEDALPSHAAEDFFTLLSNLASLRHHPEVINTLTPQDEKKLDEALKDYKINTRHLAENFIEPLRKDYPAEADYIYDLIRRLIYTSFIIGATIVVSDSTYAFLQSGIIRDVAVSRAANARKGKDKKPDQIALKNAVYKFQKHESKETYYRHTDSSRNRRWESFCFDDAERRTGNGGVMLAKN